MDTCSMRSVWEIGWKSITLALCAGQILCPTTHPTDDDEDQQGADEDQQGGNDNHQDDDGDVIFAGICEIPS